MRSITIKSIVFTSILVLTLTVKQGDTIRCYECNSHLDARCAEKELPSDLIKDCGEHKHGLTYTFCRKIVQEIENNVNGLPPDHRIIRQCGWNDSAYRNSCYHRAGFGGRQDVCSCYEDNCNSAATFDNALIVVVTALFAVILFFKGIQSH